MPNSAAAAYFRSSNSGRIWCLVEALEYGIYNVGDNQKTA
jgi:hypothetical protein